jgi:hypothetical protein
MSAAAIANYAHLAQTLLPIGFLIGGDKGEFLRQGRDCGELNGITLIVCHAEAARANATV